MRRIARGLLVVLISVFIVCHSALAADYTVVVVPDNVAHKPCLDAFIYEESSEFFATQVINSLNLSGTVECPTVSDVRERLKKSPRLLNSTNAALSRFKKGYNVDFINAQKLAKMYNTNKVLLITTSADAQNYFMRRTLWDFLDIPGATVIDPAIKLSTYAVLIDTDRNVELWSNTFYKPISSAENRMVASTLTPNTEQLEKVKDYSRLLAPQIAQNVQRNVVPATLLTKSNTIKYGPEDFDNIFTKKFRWYGTNAKIIYSDTRDKYGEHLQKERENGIEPFTDKIHRIRMEHKKRIDAKRLEKAKSKYERIQKKYNKEGLDNTFDNVQDINIKTPYANTPTNNVIEINNQSKQDTKDIQLAPLENNSNTHKIKYYPIKPRLKKQQNTTINDI